MARKITQTAKQVNLRIPVRLVQRIDKARGDVSRNLWIRRAIEQRLERGDKA